jgi:NAD(P)-dependent dehydrogenase (short-subunit alcohol dehydrogenase family)
MLLENKNPVIYGAGGAIGGAVTRAFAREGTRVFLIGRMLSPVNVVAEQISAEGGTAEANQVDAVDEQSVEEHIRRGRRKSWKNRHLIQCDWDSRDGGRPPMHAGHPLHPAPVRGLLSPYHHLHAGSLRDRQGGGG